MFTKRQMLLLQLLEEQVDWITSAELGRLSGFSYKTVQHDVQLLADVLPTNWSIERMKGRGLKLVKPLHEAVSSTLQAYNQDPLVYEIIQKITTGQVDTIEALSESIYLNVSSLHQLLKEVDQQLDDYSLTLSRSPLQLVGPESLIRLYLQKLMKGMFGESRLFYTSYAGHTQYVQAFKQLERTVGIILYPLPLANVLWFIDIAVSRIKAGFHATIDDRMKEMAMENKHYRDLDDFIQVIESSNGIHMTVDERVLLFLTLVHTEFTYAEMIKQPSETLLVVRERQEILAFVSLLEDELGLSLHGNSNFLLGLFDFDKKMRLRYSLALSLFAANREATLLVQELYSQTYTQLEGIWIRWAEQRKYQHLTSDALSDLTLLVEQAKLESGYYRKKVLLISTDSYKVDQFTHTLLDHHFSGRMEIICDNQQIPDHALLDRLAIDFIISDTPVDFADVQVVLINRIPTPKDLANIEQMLQKR